MSNNNRARWIGRIFIGLIWGILGLIVGVVGLIFFPMLEAKLFVGKEQLAKVRIGECVAAFYSLDDNTKPESISYSVCFKNGMQANVNFPGATSFAIGDTVHIKYKTTYFTKTILLLK